VGRLRRAVGVPRDADGHRDGPRRGHHLGAVHRGPDPGHAHADHPAVPQADQVHARHAGAAAGDGQAPGQVQGQEGPAVPAGHGPGADGAVQEPRLQPVLRLPAHPGADAHLLRAVPGPQRRARVRGRRRGRARPERGHRAVLQRGHVLRRPAVLHAAQPRRRQPRGHDPPGDRDDRRDVRLAVLHPEAADGQEHERGREGLPHVPPAADDAVPVPPGLRDRRHQLPHRRPHLLDRLQRLVHGPAVVGHPQQPDPGLAGRAGAQRAPRRQGAPPGRQDRGGARGRHRGAACPRRRRAASAAGRQEAPEAAGEAETGAITAAGRPGSTPSPHGAGAPGPVLPRPQETT
jgi:hypothetical protein